VPGCCHRGRACWAWWAWRSRSGERHRPPSRPTAQTNLVWLENVLGGVTVRHRHERSPSVAANKTLIRIVGGQPEVGQGALLPSSPPDRPYFMINPSRAADNDPVFHPVLFADPTRPRYDALHQPVPRRNASSATNARHRPGKVPWGAPSASLLRLGNGSSSRLISRAQLRQHPGRLTWFRLACSPPGMSPATSW